MKVDKAPCWHCRRMFEPWTNERYCSDTCHDAAQKERMHTPVRGTPFNPVTFVFTANHVHALASTSGADCLAWDHTVPGGELRAMTNREALDMGFERLTNRGTLNDWSRDPACWNHDRSDVTPSHATYLAEVLTEWLRRVACTCWAPEDAESEDHDTDCPENPGTDEEEES